MKKNYVILVVCLLAVMALIARPMEAIAQSSQGDGTEIIIQPTPLIPQGTPRAPVFNPFYAYWEGSCVSLGSTSSYGTVSVCIVSTAGDYVTTGFDTDDGIILIPISGNTGHYILTIVTESGLVFEGEFDIY